MVWTRGGSRKSSRSSPFSMSILLENLESKTSGCIPRCVEIAPSWSSHLSQGFPLQPLSMTLLRQPQQIQTVDPNQDLESNDSERNSTTSTHPRYPRHIAALITPFHERKQHMEEKPTVTEHGAPEALDIAVLIAMPSEEHPFSRHPTFGMSFAQDKNRASSENSNKPLPEVQIGVTTIPWHTEIASVP